MIYLDNSATTCVEPETARIALRQMTARYGNPSSLHHFGMEAYQDLVNARYQLARSISAPTSCVCFTSGGTESNNLAIQGIAANAGPGCHIVTTAIEHSSVLSCCQALEKRGVAVTYVIPNPATHRIHAQDIIDAVTSDTILVSVMHVNNETGEVLPVGEICRGVHKKNPQTIVHCDAVQSFGKLETGLHLLGADLLSASGHKIHAPKGIGMLYVRQGLSLTPLKFGGAQEGGMNPGTENVPLACSFGAAAEERLLHLHESLEYVSGLNQYLREGLQRSLPKVHINSQPDFSPYILNFSLPGHDSSALVDALSMKDIYVSAGAACATGTPSHVLTAAGYSRALVSSALRISFCESNTKDELDQLLQALLTLCRTSQNRL